MPPESVAQRLVPLADTGSVGTGFDRQRDCLAYRTMVAASALAGAAVVAQVVVAPPAAETVVAEFAAVPLVGTVQEPFVPKLSFHKTEARTQL